MRAIDSTTVVHIIRWGRSLSKAANYEPEGARCELDVGNGPQNVLSNANKINGNLKEGVGVRGVDSGRAPNKPKLVHVPELPSENAPRPLVTFKNVNIE